MPMFKVWNVSRTIKKAVVVNTLEYLFVKGKEKLGLNNEEVYRLFDEEDGTEIDDDDCLLSYEKGSVFVLGTEWMSRDQIREGKQQGPEVGFQRDENESKNLSDLTVQDDFGLDDVLRYTESTSMCENTFELVGQEEDFRLGNVAGDSKLDSAGESTSYIKSKDDFELGDAVGDTLTKSPDSRRLSCIERLEKEFELGDVVGATEIQAVGESMLDVKEKGSIAASDVVGLKSEENSGSTSSISETGRSVKETILQKRKAIDSSEGNSDLNKKGPLGQKKSVSTFLMENKYRHAKMKKLKIFSETEINNAKADMEKKRRHFWNEKAEQLSSKAKTANLSKTALAGIIDVSWTLRKTSFIEEKARRIANDEAVFIRSEDYRKDGIQKKETIPKNLERMASAHAVVNDLNEKMEIFRDDSNKPKSQKEMERLHKEYLRLKTLLDGAYSELKKAQDAAMKAINVKKQLLNMYFASKSKCKMDDETIQYTSKLLGYLLQKHGATADTVKLIKTVEVHISTSRKLFRIGKYFDMLQGAFRNLSVKDTALRLLVVSARLTRVLYFLVDQIVWATRLGLYKSDPKAWSKFQAKIWSVALILCVTRNMYDIYNLVKAADKKNEDPGAQTVCWYEKFKTRPEVFVDTVKNCADFLMPLNIIGVIEINNGIVGVLGLISSLAGASTVWEPTLKLKP